MVLSCFWTKADIVISEQKTSFVGVALHIRQLPYIIVSLFSDSGKTTEVFFFFYLMTHFIQESGPAPVMKGPIPSEHFVLQNTFNGLAERCKNTANNPVSFH